MAKSITVYTQAACAYCAQVKRLLDLKQHAYTVVDLDEHPAEREALIAKTGARTVPIVVVRDDADDTERFAIGWNPAQLMAAIS